MRRHWFLWLILLVYAGYLLWPQLRTGLGLGADVGAEAPAFEASDLQGNLYSSSALRGKVVLVNFWATWCPPCRTEMPGFQNIYEDLHERGFEILAISMDEGGREPVAQFVAELGLTFPVIAEQSRLARAFDGGNALPTTYLIDREGRVRHRFIGARDEADVRAAIQTLLQEPAPANTHPR